jgi:hypothetical protein
MGATHSPAVISECRIPNLHQEGLLVLVSGTVSVVRGDDGSPNDLVFRGAGERAAVSA